MVPTVSAHNVEHWPNEKEKISRNFKDITGLLHTCSSKKFYIYMYDSYNLIGDGQNCCIPNFSLKPNFIT